MTPIVYFGCVVAIVYKCFSDINDGDKKFKYTFVYNLVFNFEKRLTVKYVIFNILAVGI